MDCRQITVLLGPFVDGELDSAKERSVRQHLDCADCSAELADLRRIGAGIRGATAKAADGADFTWLWAGVRRGIAEEPPPTLWQRIRDRLRVAPAHRPFLWIAVLAALLIVVGIGSPLTNWRTSERDWKTMQPPHAELPDGNRLHILVPLPQGDAQVSQDPESPKQDGEPQVFELLRLSKRARV